MIYRISACVLSTVILAGCGGDTGPRKVSVAGTVTFNGEPLESGEIVLRATSGGDPAGAGQISAGKFECKVTPGSKTVSITAWKEESGPAEGLETGEAGGVSEQYLPATYNDETTLTAEIGDDGNSDLVFELKAE